MRRSCSESKLRPFSSHWCLFISSWFFKAPHHSAQSWGSFWSNNHDIPDKILAAAQGDEDDEDESSEEERVVVRRRPKYKELSSDEEDDADDDADADAEGDDDEEAEDLADIEIPPFDESAMGPKGGPFTDADLAITARHVASFQNFRAVSFQEKWGPYGAKASFFWDYH